MQREILEQVIITKKSPQRKTLHILKTNVFELLNTKNIGQLLIKLISFLNYIKCWYYNTPSVQLPCLPRHLSQISPWPIETLIQRNPHPVLRQFPCLFLPHSTTHHNYWIYQTIWQAKFVIQYDKPSLSIYIQYKMSWILYKVVGALSLSQP